MGAAPGTGEHYVLPSQLCVGLHVHLDLPWVDHPFTFSSFRIKALEEITAIQSLGLSRVRYSPAKSDAKPLAVPPESAESTAAVPLSREDDPAYLAKRVRIEQWAAQRAKVAACDQAFLTTTRRMKAVRQNIFSLPAEVCQRATAAIDHLSGTMLVDADLTIHLVSDKASGTDVYAHSLNVTLMSMMIGKEMKLAAEQVQLLGLGALFHDLGDIDVPADIRVKTTPLTKSEDEAMRKHCGFGVVIGKKLGLPPEVLLIIAQHHERFDGSGYPMGLRGEQQSPLSRIVAVVNAFDELCNPVNPARAATPHEALSIIYAQQRAQFDKSVIASFIRCMGVYPPGTVVLLSNGALGMVTWVNNSRPLKPTVLVYDEGIAPEDAILVDLEDESDVTIVKALRPRQLPPAAHQFLSPRKRLSYYISAGAEAK